jgi:hypothetical protein
MGSKAAKVLIVAAVLLAVGAVAVGAQTASPTASPSAAGGTVSKQCYSVPCQVNQLR